MRPCLRRALAASMLISALAPGCGRDADKSSGAAASGEDTDERRYDPDARAIVEMPQYPSTMKLVEAGAELREPLRHGAFGSSRRVEFVTYTFHGEDDNEAEPFFSMILTWAGVDTGGESLGYRWAVVKAKNDFDEPSPDAKFDKVSDSIRKMFENVRGQATGTGTGLTDVIQTKGAKVTPSPVAQLHMFAVPLPEEPVGVGAVWERTTDPGLVEDPEGPEMRKLLRRSKPVAKEDQIIQVDRYTLADRQGDVLTIDYEMSVRVRSQDEPGQTATGRFAVVLGDPLAQAGSFDLVTVHVWPAHDGGEERRSESRQRIALEPVE